MMIPELNNDLEERERERERWEARERKMERFFFFTSKFFKRFISYIYIY